MNFAFRTFGALERDDFTNVFRNKQRNFGYQILGSLFGEKFCEIILR